MMCKKVHEKIFSKRDLTTEYWNNFQTNKYLNFENFFLNNRFRSIKIRRKDFYLWEYNEIYLMPFKLPIIWTYKQNRHMYLK